MLKQRLRNTSTDGKAERLRLQEPSYSVISKREATDKLTIH